MLAIAPIALLPLTPQLTDTLNQILAGTPVAPPANVLEIPAPSVTVTPTPGVVVDGRSTPSDRPTTTAGSGAVAGLPAAAPADLRAPAATVRILSTVRRAATTGRLRLAVRIDEAGVVALAAAVRPGAKARSVRGGKKHWRGVLHAAPAVNVLATPGEHVVALKLPASKRRHLANARDARISVALLAADAARNQVAFRVKRTVKR